MAKKSKKAAEVTIDINANVASLAKDMKKVTAELDGLGRKVTSLNKIMKAQFAFDVFKTAIPYIKQFTGSLTALADRGDRAGDIAGAFDRLGGSALQLEKAKQATLGMVSATDLMQIANEGLLKQIPGYAENFGKIADLGARVADTLGIDTKEGIKQVTDALGSAKEKQLQALGITINAEQAYRDYADAIGQSAKTLSDQQKQEARQLAAMQALDGTLSKMSPLTDSVANAFGALQAAISDALDEIGQAINDNDHLRESFRELIETVQSIDWVEFGNDMAEVGAIIVETFNFILPIVKGVFDQVAYMLRVIDRTMLEGAANGYAGSMDRAIAAIDSEDAVKKKVAELKGIQSGIAALNKEIANAATKKEAEELIPILGGLVDQWKGLDGEAPAIKKSLQETTIALGKQIEVLPEVAKQTRKFGGVSVEAMDAAAQAAKKAAKEVEGFQDKWKQLQSKNQADGLKKGLKESIENLDYDTFNKLKEQLQQAVKQGFVDEWQGAIDSGAVSFEEVQAEGEKMAQAVGDELEKEMTKAAKEAAQKAREEYAQAFDDLGSAMSGIADNFGVDLQGVFSTASKYFKEDMTDLMEGLGESLGMTGAEMGAYFQAFSTTAQAAIDAKGTDKANKSNKGTGGAVGAGLGAVVGGIFGGGAGAALGAEIGKVAGEIIGDQFKWGPQNADTKARHVFANWLEDQLAQLNAFTLRDKNGQYQTVRGEFANFVEGDTGRFNDGTWAETMNSWGEAATMFAGLGNAFKHILGLTEEVGAQIGYLLGENLAGNIDNARLLVYQLGVSFEDLSNALLDMAKKGEITWREYTVQVAGLGEAFKPGLQGVADLKGAWDELVGSGGRGMAALKGIKDIAVEAIEGGARSLEQLREKLIAGGVKPEDADAFLTALRENGVRTVDEIKNLSEAQLGAIVSSLEAHSSSIAEQWAKVGANLEKIKWDLDALPTEKDIKIRFSAEFDENMKKANESGLLDKNQTNGTGINPVDSPETTTKQARVSSSQVRMASSRVSGENLRASSASVNISIDARNAEVGVEEKIASVMSTYRDAIVRDAATTVLDYQARG